MAIVDGTCAKYAANNSEFDLEETRFVSRTSPLLEVHRIRL